MAILKQARKTQRVAWVDGQGQNRFAIKLQISQAIDREVIESMVDEIAEMGCEARKIICSSYSADTIRGLYADRIRLKDDDSGWVITAIYFSQHPVVLDADSRCGDSIYILYENQREIKSPEFAHLEVLP